MTTMTTRAAVLHKPGTDWEISELDLEPKEYEILIRYKAAGLCHSDEHIRAEGGSHIRCPLVGGHDGAGIVEAVGPGVTRVQPGDHVVTSYIPACGKCRYCSTGHQNLCDRGLYAGVGCLQDETFRFHKNGGDSAGSARCLVGCGVTTGWSSAVRAGETRASETVVVMGVGGVGINAVQGARYAGATRVVAIDPNPFKLDMAKRLGATHTFTNVDEAREQLIDLTRGQMADLTVVTVGVLEPEITADAVSLIGAGRAPLGQPGRRQVDQLDRLTDGRVAQADPGLAGRRLEPDQDAQPARPVQVGSPQARRDHHPALPARAGQRGPPRPAGRQERPRRGHPRELSAGATAAPSTAVPSPRSKPGGTSTSSRVSSEVEQRRRPSSAESIPARRMSSTFSTPAWPAAANPHR
jgi:S-(hydroxymethyl)glutathione dehydrogenase/alcohol dehydrogenase